MEKIDYKKELAELYKPKAGVVVEIEVPEMNFLMVDGRGDPNTAPAFQEAVEVLFSVSYSLKFMVKKGERQIDYGVMPLEGFWWSDDMAAFSVEDKSDWKWTLMIMQPEFVDSNMVISAGDEVKRKKNPAALSLLRFESFREGLSVQTLHKGPFSEEGPTVEFLHNFIDEHGWKRCGKHHEIYLSDIRRAAPEKWRTVIRQPISK